MAEKNCNPARFVIKWLMSIDVNKKIKK